VKSRICVASACYGNAAIATLPLPFAGTLFALGKQLDVLCGEQGWGHGDVQIEPAIYGNSMVHARSDLVRRFLAAPADYTHLMFWDLDVCGGTPKQVASLLTKMLKADKDIVGVPYIQKHIFWEQAARAVLDRLHQERSLPSTVELVEILKGYSVRYVPDFSQLPIGKVVDDLCEMPRIPIGFSLLKRSMLEAMVAKYADGLSYERQALGGPPETCVGLFAMTLEGRVLSDEDYAFCDRWRAMGGKMHLYVGEGAPLGHLGAHMFEGTNAAMRADWSHR
jgi:hypothetical protein